MMTTLRNPRKIKPAQLDALGKDLAEFGDLSGIVVNADGWQIGGNQRMKIIAKEGEIVITDRFEPADKHGTTAAGFILWRGGRYTYRQVDWPADKAKRANVIANNAGGSFDWDILREDFSIEELNDVGFDDDFLAGMREDADKLAELLAGDEGAIAAGDAEPQIDKAAELQEKWQTAAGQLWAIGEHRLICGDCTDDATVARLMGNETFRLLFTSPPYADQREYHLETFDWLATMNGMIDAAYIHANQTAGDIVINLGMSYSGGKVNFYWDEWLRHCEAIGPPLYGWYVWDKSYAMPGDRHGRLGPAHEFLFHFSIGHKQANKWIETKDESRNRNKETIRFRQKDGGLKRAGKDETIGQSHKIPDSVVRITPQNARTDLLTVHPATFPAALPEFMINTWSDAGDLVLDPFLGSGTTLVACQNTGRRGRGVEISPAYCAVILERMITAFPDLDIHLISEAGE